MINVTKSDMKVVMAILVLAVATIFAGWVISHYPAPTKPVVGLESDGEAQLTYTSMTGSRSGAEWTYSIHCADGCTQIILTAEDLRTAGEIHYIPTFGRVA